MAYAFYACLKKSLNYCELGEQDKIPPGYVALLLNGQGQANNIVAVIKFLGDLEISAE